jgi:ABC-type sulfate transport system substrate-binding protein
MENPDKTNDLHSGWYRIGGWILAAILVLVSATYLGWTIMNGPPAATQLVVYAFSTQEEVFDQGIFPAFEKEWEGETGEDLQIEAVFGPSGTLAGQINLGAPADVVIFSNANHVNWLKFGRRVKEDTEPVMIGATPIIIVTLSGNPLNLAEWSDLTQTGLRLIHADPDSSGVGEWAILAEYDSAYLESGDPETAQTQLQGIWNNVRLLAPSARSAMTLFELGVGDALLTYEQDARLALARGVSLDIVIPSRTVIARPVAVLVDDNINSSERAVAQAFMDFLIGPEGQNVFNQYHLRPLSLNAPGFPILDQPFTEEDLGGWTQAYTELVEQLWQTQIEPHLDLEPVPALLNPEKWP